MNKIDINKNALEITNKYYPDAQCVILTGSQIEPDFLTPLSDIDIIIIDSHYAGMTCDCLKHGNFKIGYTNVKKHLGYDLSIITSMIDKGNPVFIGALSGVFGGGHAWVIDGYKSIRKETSSGGRRNPVTGGPTYTTNVISLVHCNFGWAGLSNGYYASGVFNIKNGPYERHAADSPYDSGVTSNYNWWFRVLTYDNPNK